MLTTHNLATLAGLGVVPAGGWAAAARAAFEDVVRLVGVARGQERPLGTVKNAAYAWRQAVFFLSQCSVREVDAFTAHARQRVAACTEASDRARLGAVLDGLATARTAPLPDGRMRVHRGPVVQPFYGWTTGPHWLLEVG